jgi:hypothetical protein
MTATNNNHEAAESLGMMLEEYIARHVFRREVDETDHLYDIVNTEFGLKELKVDRKTQRIIIFMQNDDQYYVDMKIHKAKDEDKVAEEDVEESDEEAEECADYPE